MSTPPPTEYLWFTKEEWDLLFAGLNASLLVFGIPFGVRALRQSVVQRMNESLSKVLEEYRGPSFRDSVRHTIEHFPVTGGTVEERVRSFVQHGSENLSAEDMVHARNVVHKLNDLGAFVEQGGVREADFYGQTFPRVLEMSYRLEPLVLTVSARGSFRWGMRLRRMRLGAERYIQKSSVHSRRGFTVDGVEVVTTERMGRVERAYRTARKWAGVPAFMPSMAAMAADDEACLRLATGVLDEFEPDDLAFLDHTI